MGGRRDRDERSKDDGVMKMRRNEVWMEWAVKKMNSGGNSCEEGDGWCL